MVKATGAKLKVEFSPFHKGPGQKDRYDAYVRDLGDGLREVVPTLASTWLKLRPEHQAPLTDYMELYYEVPSTQEMKDFFTKKAIKCYSQWKYDCHQHYLEFGGEETPLEFVHRPEQWRWLVKNDFEDEKQKAVCERNKKNRTKNPNPINHHSGPIPISFRAEALMKNKHPAGIIQACIDVYEPCPNAKDRVDKLKSHVEDIIQAREGDAPEQQEPLPVDEQTSILLDCLGERRGTEVRGMGGAGERPAKKRGGLWTARAMERERELAEAKQEAAAAKEEAAEAKALSLVAMERMAAMEKMMQQLLAAGTSSQPSVTSAAVPSQATQPSTTQQSSGLQLPQTSGTSPQTQPSETEDASASQPSST